MPKKKRKSSEKDRDKDKNKPKVPDEENLPSIRDLWHAVVKSGVSNSCRYCGEHYSTPKATMSHAKVEHTSVFLEFPQN